MSKYRHAKGLSPMQILIIVAIVIVSLAIIGGGAFAAIQLTKDKEEPTVAPTIATTAPTVAPATIDEPATEADSNAQYTELAKKHLENMTIDEKIYQMLVVTPEALTGVDVATAAGDATKTSIEKYPVGGIYYSADNFEDATQTTDMIKNSQSYAKTSMFIAVSEEGGENAPVASKLSTTKVDFTFAEENVENEIMRLKNEGVFTENEADAINITSIKNFIASDLFKRIKSAEKFIREKQFTMTAPLSFVRKDLPEGAEKESVVLQGIMDGLIINGNTGEIIDYKTDRVETEEELCDRYREQMRVYKAAAEQCFGLENVTVTLYSFSLSKEISIKL